MTQEQGVRPARPVYGEIPVESHLQSAAEEPAGILDVAQTRLAPVTAHIREQVARGARYTLEKGPLTLAMGGWYLADAWQNGFDHAATKLPMIGGGALAIATHKFLVTNNPNFRNTLAGELFGGMEWQAAFAVLAGETQHALSTGTFTPESLVVLLMFADEALGRVVGAREGMFQRLPLNSRHMIRSAVALVTTGFAADAVHSFASTGRTDMAIAMGVAGVLNAGEALMGGPTKEEQLPAVFRSEVHGHAASERRMLETWHNAFMTHDLDLIRNRDQWESDQHLRKRMIARIQNSTESALAWQAIADHVELTWHSGGYNATIPEMTTQIPSVLQGLIDRGVISHRRAYVVYNADLPSVIAQAGTLSALLGMPRSLHDGVGAFGGNVKNQGWTDAWEIFRNSLTISTQVPDHKHALFQPKKRVSFSLSHHVNPDGTLQKSIMHPATVYASVAPVAEQPEPVQFPNDPLTVDEGLSVEQWLLYLGQIGAENDYRDIYAAYHSPQQSPAVVRQWIAWCEQTYPPTT